MSVNIKQTNWAALYQSQGLYSPLGPDLVSQKIKLSCVLLHQSLHIIQSLYDYYHSRGFHDYLWCVLLFPFNCQDLCYRYCTQKLFHPQLLLFGNSLLYLQNTFLWFSHHLHWMSLWVIDVDFLDSQTKWIWIINFMNFHVSL